MSTEPARFSFSPTNITGIAEAVVFIVTAVVAFVKGSSPVVDIAAVGAALHGIGHGLRTH